MQDIDRKNLVNNLFKSIIDISIPDMVKYIFWACENNSGIFEQLNEDEYMKYKRMSKYKKDEIIKEEHQSEASYLQ